MQFGVYNFCKTYFSLPCCILGIDFQFPCQIPNFTPNLKPILKTGPFFSVFFFFLRGIKYHPANLAHHKPDHSYLNPKKKANKK